MYENIRPHHVQMKPPTRAAETPSTGLTVHRVPEWVTRCIATKSVGLSYKYATMRLFTSS